MKVGIPRTVLASASDDAVIACVELEQWKG